MRDIKFVSYDGRYPNLCSGVLTLSVDGNEFQWCHCLVSTGNVYINFDTGEESIEAGSWRLSFDKKESGYELYTFRDRSGYGFIFSEEEIEHITNLVNDNVEQGCCGGCI